MKDKTRRGRGERKEWSERGGNEVVFSYCVPVDD